MVKPYDFVNRKLEIYLFELLIQRKIPERVLTIIVDGQQGKW